MKKIYVLLSLVLTTILTGCDLESLIPDDISVSLNEGQDTVEINSEWIDAGASITINSIVYDMYSESEVDTSTLGLYKVTYTYDYKDKHYEIFRYVIVVDQTRPEVTLNPGVDTIHVGELWVDAGVTATDNLGEAPTLETSGTVDNNTLGTYQIVYTVTDPSGNTNTIVRYVKVIE